ncbi:hypothetical protein OOK31_03470 [Streptomyces sp. NBC_00249]|uniref:hypothetical protein n=1 Tax=Streptomyces sp. NBC_00249 TaxID=2975690 RepID=UPI00224E2725|nr:hypothetical protein [Streptomyces sp. NBC_00249]MCX5192960.1 hypothetical protein [Streptomyces sp. NBC_00249]
MGAIRSSAIALLSAGATGAALAFGALGAPAALAAEAAPITSFGFAITPSTVAPGGQTVLSVTGCDAAYATASSGVFDTVSIARGQTVRVTVDRDARRGAQYSVSFTCDGETGSADLTIAGGTTRPSTSSTSGPRTPRATAPAPAVTRTTAPAAPRTTAPATPRATTGAVTGVSRGATLGVRGGLGGSVAGMDPLELGAGAGLFLAAVGVTAYALRRRGSTRGH